MKTQNKAMKTRKQNYGQTVNKTVAMRQESKTGDMSVPNVTGEKT